jgi:phasin family protein
MELLLSPANLLGEIARTVEHFKLPGLDARTLIEGRRKDIEALAEANRIALGGMQELARKQGEILQTTLRELQTLVQQGPVGLAQDPTKVGAIVQRTLQEALGNMHDLVDVARKSQTDAFRVASERMQRNIEEIRTSLQAPKAKKAERDA